MAPAAGKEGGKGGWGHGAPPGRLALVHDEAPEVEAFVRQQHLVRLLDELQGLEARHDVELMLRRARRARIDQCPPEHVAATPRRERERASEAHTR